MELYNLKEKIKNIAQKYHMKKVVLFGSRADNTCREDSDVDLIVEFYEPVSLLRLAKIKLAFEEIIGLPVDIVHGPLQKDDLLEVNKEIELYVA